MEAPFFTNGRWYQQPTRHPFSRSPSLGGVPVYQFDPAMEVTPRPVRQRPTERNPSGAKVVHIPVQFVGSEQVDRSGSALKIQKVFRGFLVRKCLKKIKGIKAQVDEIENWLMKSDVVDSVRKDEKERLRMNESLMSLLFKLDSICGVDFGVRGYRKAVIRKAISLQERIDAIAAVDLQVNGKTVDHVAECHDSFNQKNDYEEISGDANWDNPKMEVGSGNDGEIDIIDVGVDREVKVISEGNCAGIHEKSDLVETGKQEKDDDKRNRELLERMIEDNEKMMRLMTQLFERNEMQTRMINGLTHRVEMLEKAFVCDGKLRKIKKKNKKKAPANGCRED